MNKFSLLHKIGEAAVDTHQAGGQWSKEGNAMIRGRMRVVESFLHDFEKDEPAYDFEICIKLDAYRFYYIHVYGNKDDKYGWEWEVLVFDKDKDDYVSAGIEFLAFFWELMEEEMKNTPKQEASA